MENHLSSAKTFIVQAEAEIVSGSYEAAQVSLAKAAQSLSRLCKQEEEQFKDSEMRTTDYYIFFWKGWLSQWYAISFTVDAIIYNCCEQYMMAEKARLFEDKEHLEDIMATSSPSLQKKLGRLVENFNEDEWNSVCKDVVYRGNLAKFSQNESLKEKLLSTGSRVLVEANPYDKIWGVGLAADDTRIDDPDNWKGMNWLGEVIMKVRDDLS